MGRPAKVDFSNKRVLNNITKLVASGYTEASIAKHYNYHPTHFVELKKKYPELTAAIKNGYSTVEQLVMNEFHHIMFDRNNNKQMTALIFYAKSRLGWVDSINTPEAPKKTTKLTFNEIEKKDA